MQTGDKIALHKWQERVISCREGRGETEDESWQRAARWYESWVRNNDYVVLTMPRLLPLLDRESRVLEIGPGTGAFTMPLAQAVGEVVAVEPSVNMREILNHNLSQAGIENVHVIPNPIEEAVESLNGSFDLAFASYSLYNVEPIDRVIRDLAQLARHIMVLIGSGERRGWQRDLHSQFRGRDLVSAPQLQYFYPLLLEMGIYADVQVFTTSHNSVYDSEAALIDWWQRYFHLDDSQRDSLRSALLPLTEQRGSQIGIYDQSRVALVWIEPGRSLKG